VQRFIAIFFLIQEELGKKSHCTRLENMATYLKPYRSAKVLWAMPITKHPLYASLIFSLQPVVSSQHFRTQMKAYHPAECQ